MLQDAVSYYHELLTEREVAESSRAMLDEGLERARLIFGGRSLSPYLRPHFVSEEDFARVTRVCETVWGAIQKVKDAADGFANARHRLNSSHANISYAVFCLKKKT